MEPTYRPNQKILYVDDEPGLLSTFTSMMKRGPLEPYTLDDPELIDSTLEAHGPFAVVLSDQRMPGKDGVEVLASVARHHPETIRIMVTGFADYHDTVRAINEGQIKHFVSKPWDDRTLRTLLEESVLQYNLLTERRYLTEQLQAKNAELTELLEGTVAGTSRLLSDLVGYVNQPAAGQVDRVRRLGNALLPLIADVSETERWEIQRALELFNLGLTFLPPWIQITLNKDGLGSLHRFPVALNHHLTTAKLLEGIPRFSGVAQIIRFMAKNFDGTGEPADAFLRGKDIPLGSRLLYILLDLERKSTPNFKGREVLEHMMKYPHKYDVDLIQTTLGRRESHDGTIREATVSVDELRPGMVLLQNVTTREGEFLLGADTILNETSINILLQWNKREEVEQSISVRILE